MESTQFLTGFFACTPALESGDFQVEEGREKGETGKTFCFKTNKNFFHPRQQQEKKKKGILIGALLFFF